MTYWKFIAFTPSYGLAGTPYQLQMGQINRTWVIRLIKNSTIVKQQLFGGDQIRIGCNGSESGLPKIDFLVSWVKEVLPIQIENDVHVVNIVRGMRTMAEDQYQKYHMKLHSTGKRESETIKLKPVDPKEMKHHKPHGVVVENGTEERDYLLSQLHMLQGELQKLKFENINLKEEIKLLRSANTRISSL
jgi:hypothetical protein